MNNLENYCYSCHGHCPQCSYFATIPRVLQNTHFLRSFSQTFLCPAVGPPLKYEENITKENFDDWNQYFYYLYYYYYHPTNSSNFQYPAANFSNYNHHTDSPQHTHPIYH